ncbi:hypothetical protein [Thermomonas haemolytica]|uniref:hypothetical protein n=1 Tax=Thermomonas haemolytica TaxID=141949 RepID=UPI001123E9DC|nr:hypothetical protein [Thermomonas haemolytica]
MAAFLAIFVAVSHTTPFESYRRDGNLVVQLWLISLTMLVLIAAFVFSMVMLTSAVSTTVASIVIYLIASSLLMILISLMPIVFILLQVANARAA